MTADEIMNTKVSELLKQDTIWFYLLNRIGVEDKGYITPCWLMEYNGDSEYALMPNSRRKFGSRAHQVAYHIWKGERVQGCQIHHLCGQTYCINPDHLEEVTPTQHAKYRQSRT